MTASHIVCFDIAIANLWLCCAGSAGPRRDGEGTRAPVETERRSGEDDGQFLHAVVLTSNRII